MAKSKVVRLTKQQRKAKNLPKRILREERKKIMRKEVSIAKTKARIARGEKKAQEERKTYTILWPMSYKFPKSSEQMTQPDVSKIRPRIAVVATLCGLPVWWIIKRFPHLHSGLTYYTRLPEDPKELGPYIDHTALKHDCSTESIRQLAAEAEANNFRSVCVHSCWISLLKFFYTGRACAVVGFPLGQTATPVKAAETKTAILDGASEIDMVINVGELYRRNYGYVHNDIAAVVKVAREFGDRNVVVKVILECCLLEEESIIDACILSVVAGADFVKTSTGFSTGGATVEDIQLMRAVVGHQCGVKASGGVRTMEAVHAMIRAGASRIGTSSGLAIVGATSAEAPKKEETKSAIQPVAGDNY